MVNDPLSDLIIRIKNASAVGKETVVVPFSQVKMNVLKILEREGYVVSVAKRGRKARKVIDVGISYTEGGSPRVRGVKRISKPSRRVYLGAGDIKTAKREPGTLIISTPKGVITDKEALKRNIGGEALLEIW